MKRLLPAAVPLLAVLTVGQALAQGDAVIFPVRDRPAEGQRGPYRLTLRHGVSRITRGRRLTLGVIFHDAA